MKNKKGFTLAEVLITLSIIGVVAALTLPGLFSDYRNKQTIAAVKKAYTILEGAMEQALLNDGDIEDWNYVTDGLELKDGEYVSSKTKSSSSLAKHFTKYMKILKDCGSDAGCVPTKVYTLKNRDYSSENVDYNTQPRYYKFITTDGMSYWMRDNYNPGIKLSDSRNSACASEDVNGDNYCGEIWVDVNGLKEPNTFGRDIFTFFITKTGVKPVPNDDCTLDDDGWGCADYIIKNGNMDYLEED